MKVEALMTFNDLEAKVERQKGEQWEVTEERYEAILSVTEYGTLVKAVEEPDEAAGDKVTKRRRKPELPEEAR